MPVGRTTVLEVDELGIEMIVEEEVGLKWEGRAEETSVRNLGGKPKQQKLTST